MKPKPDSAPIGQVFNGFTSETRNTTRVAAIFGSSVFILALGYVGLAAYTSGWVPPHTKVAGIDVGNMDGPAIEKALETGLAPSIGKSIKLSLGEKSTQIDPVAAKLQVDYKATAANLTDFSLNPATMLTRLFGTVKGELAINYDEKALETVAKKAGEKLKTDPVEAAINCEKNRFVRVEPKDGQEVDLDKAVGAIEKQWTNPEGVKMPGKAIKPKTSAANLDNALKDNKVLSSPLEVKVGETQTSLSVEELCENARYTPTEDSMELSFDGENLRKILLEKAPVETAPKDAEFSFASGSLKIEDSQDGAKLEPKDVAQTVLAGATVATPRSIAITLAAQPPAFTTQDAKKAGINEIIGEFSTPLPYNPPRTANLTRGAALITGQLIKPGEQFSLLATLGPLDAEHGWKPSDVIENGFHSKAAAGGLSQLSTTTYNAAFFAGMDLVEHQPHSEYFTRYPEGREATLWDPSIDMKFANPNPNPVLLQGSVGNGKVTVKIWGTKHFEVKSTTSPRFAVVAPSTEYSQSQHCEPSGAGQNGFSVTVNRERYLNGARHDKQQWTVRYRPQNKVICGPKPEATQPPAPAQPPA